MIHEMPFTEKPTLAGEATLLRPFDPDDWQIMVKILSDPEVRRLTGSVASEAQARRPMEGSEIERVRTWYQTRNERPDRLDLAITDRSTGQLIGEAVFNEWDPIRRSCNFRILIGPGGRDRGHGTQALRLMLDYGFLTLKLDMITLEVFSFNARAQRVYQKCGFELKEIRSDDLILDGTAYDTKVFRLLRETHLQKRARQ